MATNTNTHLLKENEMTTRELSPDPARLTVQVEGTGSVRFVAPAGRGQYRECVEWITSGQRATQLPDDDHSPHSPRWSAPCGYDVWVIVAEDVADLVGGGLLDEDDLTPIERRHMARSQPTDEQEIERLKHELEEARSRAKLFAKERDEALARCDEARRRLAGVSVSEWVRRAMSQASCVSCDRQLTLREVACGDGQCEYCFEENDR